MQQPPCIHPPQSINQPSYSPSSPPRYHRHSPDIAIVPVCRVSAGEVCAWRREGQPASRHRRRPGQHRAATHQQRSALLPRLLSDIAVRTALDLCSAGRSSWTGGHAAGTAPAAGPGADDSGHLLWRIRGLRAERRALVSRSFSMAPSPAVHGVYRAYGGGPGPISVLMSSTVRGIEAPGRNSPTAIAAALLPRLLSDVAVGTALVIAVPAGVHGHRHAAGTAYFADPGVDDSLYVFGGLFFNGLGAGAERYGGH